MRGHMALAQNVCRPPGTVRGLSQLWSQALQVSATVTPSESGRVVQFDSLTGELSPGRSVVPYRGGRFIVSGIARPPVLDD